MNGDGLRLLSWNVRDLLGDPLAVARVIRSAAADLVCLQEAPRWPGSRWRIAALARHSGMLFVAGGRRTAGTALLASMRADVTGVREVSFAVPSRRTRPRGAVLADVGLPGTGRFRVVSAHLPLEQELRNQHVKLLRDLLTGPLPAVVVGDLNERPGGPSWTALADLAADPDPQAGPTFPARAPDRRIDAVLAGPGVEVLEYDVWRADDRDVVLGSDHRPLLAVLRPPRRD